MSQDEEVRALTRAADQGDVRARTRLEAMLSRAQDEQDRALEILRSGRNVFLSGPAGTGKSYVLRRWLAPEAGLVQDVDGVLVPVSTQTDIAVTAMTGIAALPLGGTTLHRWAGLPFDMDELPRQHHKQWWRDYRAPEIRAARALVIDEISMCSADVLDAANVLCQHAREDQRPFGGLQVVMVGDLGQLPPVHRSDEAAKCWAHESQAWADLDPVCVTLTRVRRQSGDPAYAELLARLRLGELAPADLNALHARVAPALDGAPVLACTNARVDELNLARLTHLEGTLRTHTAGENGSAAALRALDDACPSPRVLMLREGARVICTANDQGSFKPRYANGSLGTVAAIENGAVTVTLDDGQAVRLAPHTWTLEEKRRQPAGGIVRTVVAERTQYPLRLAWAITVHKCVAPDTMVETAQGLHAIGQAAKTGVIATSEGAKAYKNFVFNPTAPALKITTKRGFEITVTLDHRMPTADRQFREAHTLRLGDALRLVRGDPDAGWGAHKPTAQPLPPMPDGDIRCQMITTPRTLDAETAEFFGLMVADGTLYRRGFRLRKRHADVAARFAALGESLFGLAPKTDFARNTFGAEFNSTLGAKWLQHVGGMAPNEKRVPACVRLASPKIQRVFLRGLFEDGSVHLKGRAFSHIEWSTCYEPMSKLVQIMLLRLGIVASRRYVPRIINGRELPQWRLWIYGLDAALFRDTIGFVAAFKNQRLSSAGARFGRLGADLKPIATDQIASIEATTCQSMCVTVPSTGSFVQDGFDGGNSQGMSLDKAHVDLRRAFGHGMAYVALSRVRSLDGLTLASKRLGTVAAHPTFLEFEAARRVTT